MADTAVTVLDTLRVSPAARLADEMRAASAACKPHVGLVEIPFAVQLGVRCTPGTSSAEAVSGALGITFPTVVGQVTGHPDRLHTIWLSPDEFLTVDVSRRQQIGETRGVEAALEGLPGQVVDLSANRTILELSGPKARDVLEKSCPGDLHPRAFPVGAAITTNLGQVPIYLHRSAKNVYRLYPRSSFAEHTVAWLLDGMREYNRERIGA